MASLRIHLLGGFLIEHNGRSLPPIPSAAARGLFAYLVTHRERRHTRDLLAGTFWPDQPEASARRRLSQTLWQIQTALTEADEDASLLDTTLDSLAFDTGAECWVDVAEFDRHSANASVFSTTMDRREIGELESAVDLYRGEFLAGFYEEWTNIERERLRGQYLAALGRLADLHKGRADYDTALGFARRLALQDPLFEEAHREVMRLCFLLGKNNEALQQYERCATILAEELGTEPGAETSELRTQIEQLRDKGERPFAPTVHAPLLDTERRIPLVGREAERIAVVRQLEEALLGVGGVVLVEGESGIGKTRLLEELSDDAQWRGLATLWGTGREESQLLPFNTVREALETGLNRLRVRQLGELLHPTLLVDLSRIVPRVREWMPRLPPPRPLRRNEAKDRITVAVREALVTLADLTPYVVFVDDAQWVDDESMDVIAAAAGEVDRHGLLVCVSYRGGEARERDALWRRVRDIDTLPRSHRVMLSPLDPGGSARLIEESLAGTRVTSDVAEGLYLETGGNPLFILETLRTWHEETRDGVAVDPGQSGLLQADQVPVAGGIAQLIARRFRSLGEMSKTVLEAVAVLGRVQDPAILSPICSLSRLDTLQALEELIRKGALVDSHDGYDFAHYQIRRVALDGLDEARRRSLHHEVAAALEERQPERVEDLAYHFSAAGEAAKAYQYSVEAGRRALALAAFETAVRHFENAHDGSEEPSEFGVYGDWEAALEVLGRRSEQDRVLAMMAAAASDAAGRSEVARRRARLLALEGNYREAVAAARSAVEASHAGSDDVPGPTLQTYGFVLSHAGRPSDAVAPLEKAVAAFADDPAAEARALCDLGNVLCDIQEYDGAAQALTGALEQFDLLEDAHGIAEASGQLAIVEMEQGHHDAAVALYTKALDLSRRLGYRRGEATNLANLANALYLEGSIAGALDRYDEAAEAFMTIGDLRGAALVRANAASVRFTILGDESAEPDLTASVEYFHEQDHRWGEAFCREHLAAIAHRRGDLEAATDHVTTALALLSGGGHQWVEVHLRRLGARIAIDDDRIDDARSHVKQASDLCDRLHLTDIAPTIEHVAAMVAIAAGDVDEALERSRVATRTLQKATEQPYVVWYGLHLAAHAAGADSEAREALNQASHRLDEVLARLQPDQKRRARSAVPEHREIIAARERMFSTERTIALPRVDVPRGRPLRTEDWIDIRWTVSEPGDLDFEDEASRRQIRLARLMAEAEDQGGSPRVVDLADALGVSRATIRRDLATMRRSGRRVSTRGSR